MFARSKRPKATGAGERPEATPLPCLGAATLLSRRVWMASLALGMAKLAARHHALSRQATLTRGFGSLRALHHNDKVPSWCRQPPETLGGADR